MKIVFTSARGAEHQHNFVNWCRCMPPSGSQKQRQPARIELGLLLRPRSEDHAFWCCRCALPTSIPQPEASRLRRPPQRSRAARAHLACRAPPRCGGVLAKTPRTHVPSHDWTFSLPLHGRWSLGWLVCNFVLLQSARTAVEISPEFLELGSFSAEILELCTISRPQTAPIDNPKAAWSQKDYARCHMYANHQVY